jgi:putative solute:sodium symporter small subunit
MRERRPAFRLRHLQASAGIRCHEAVAKGRELAGGGAHAAAADATGGSVHEEVREEVREDQRSSGVAEGAGHLPFLALAAWALLAFLVPSFVPALNLVDIFAFPLGYFMTAQGAFVAFVVIGLLSARWQDRRAARRAADR